MDVQRATDAQVSGVRKWASRGRVGLALGGKVYRLLRRPSFPASAEALLAPFTRDGDISGRDYEDLFRYFALSWLTYRTRGGTGAAYPGLPSWSGADVDALEGFSRIMPLFGAWVWAGRDPAPSLPGARGLDLARAFTQGLSEGTNPRSPFYWGDMPGKSNQRVVEAADIALALWFFGDKVWRSLAPQRRAAVVDWLSLVEGCPGLDNNWHLFFVLIDRVLTALGHPGRVPSAAAHYARVKDFHLGDGWFKDGPEGPVDFYNAWGFHYTLAWIDRIDPAWDPGFIRAAQRAFLSGYKHLIGPEGMPIMGRSLCYRMAAPAPLILGCVQNAETVSAGEARRALDAVWRYFIRHGAVRQGNVTQGYFGADPRLLDPYSGPASGLWSLRSLVAAFAHPPDAPFWRARPAALPVERADFDITMAGAGWRVRGEKATRTITTEVLDNAPDAAPPLEPVTLRQQLRRHADGTWRGPTNRAAKYQRRRYRSDTPFCCE